MTGEDVSAIDCALRIDGLTLADDWVCDDGFVLPGGGRKVKVVGRMGRSPQGTRVVICKDGKWSVEREPKR